MHPFRTAGLAVALAVLCAHPAEAQFSLQAKPPAQPPDIDGEVDDHESAGAALATAFVRFEPQRGTPSPHRTEARVLVDGQALYVAFRSWDAEPLTAQLTQRDAALSRDDSVGVLIDTFDDRQTGYFFAVNVLGTQGDYRIVDDGRTTDVNWDAPWRSATQRTEWGWSAEIAIPFASIKYVAGEARTWGINFLRSRRRSLEMSHWSAEVSYAFGRNFGSDYALWSAALKRKLTDQLSVEYELEHLTLTPDPEHDSTWIHVIRGSQFFTKDLFLRLFYQVNSAIDRHNMQATFVYRYLPPFGTVQMVYQRGTAEFGQRSSQGHTLFVKATTVF